MNELNHFGIPGMHWGIRRYQNPDGSLTPAGIKRYAVDTFSNIGEKVLDAYDVGKTLVKRGRDKSIDILENIGNNVINAYDYSSEAIQRSKQYANDILDKWSTDKANKRFNNYLDKRSELEKEIGYDDSIHNWQKVNKDFGNAQAKNERLANQMRQLDSLERDINNNRMGTIDGFGKNWRTSSFAGDDNFYNKESSSKFDNLWNIVAKNNHSSYATTSEAKAARKDLFSMLRSKRAEIERNAVEYYSQGAQAKQRYDFSTMAHQKMSDLAFSDFKQAETKMGNFLNQIDLKINEREYKKYYDMVMDDLAMHSATRHQNGSDD